MVVVVEVVVVLVDEVVVAASVVVVAGVKVNIAAAERPRGELRWIRLEEVVTRDPHRALGALKLDHRLFEFVVALDPDAVCVNVRLPLVAFVTDRNEFHWARLIHAKCILNDVEMVRAHVGQSSAGHPAPSAHPTARISASLHSTRPSVTCSAISRTPSTSS